ncbi:transposase [Acinetobacter sp. YZS-X1-1]|uniref:transposase n=1 Tax=Acinetobacter sp. YZS-X1-1 TaxID=1501691 RepID=UPI001269899B
MEDLEPELSLTYIDESGFQSDDTRSHSYNHKGTRAEGTFNWQIKNRCNAIGDLIKNKLLTVSLFNCSITTEVFEGWIEHDLLPKLKERSVFHHG